MDTNLILLTNQLVDAGLPVEGVAGDGRIDYSRPLTDAEKFLATSIILAHDPRLLADSQQSIIEANNAITDFRNFPNYASWTPQEAQDSITNMILGAQTKVQVEANISSLPATIAGMKTGLTILADAIIDIRTTLAIIGKLITYIRIVAIRR